ncbi:hypothetical protein [Rhizobium sp. PAMB 3182]
MTALLDCIFGALWEQQAVEDELSSSTVLNLWAGFSSPKAGKYDRIAANFLRVECQELFRGECIKF